MRHPAVALLELLIVIGIMGIIASMAIPLYWRYQARNNLELAKNQVTQGLERARLNARAGKYDDVWSFSVSEGILFEGSDFAGRDQSRQEVYTLPGDIVPSGILQVTYDKTGTPNTTGTVTLSSPLGDVATVQVTTIVSSQQVSTTAGSTLVICYQGTTMTITSDQWSFYQAKGSGVHLQEHRRRLLLQAHPARQRELHGRQSRPGRAAKRRRQHQRFVLPGTDTHRAGQGLPVLQLLRGLRDERPDGPRRDAPRRQ
ncbi:hypothetical protein HYR82_03425 [Candidatus Peregrinibacteria bacterium]|nr:hypothetical protein [Candidatus Peregrinibacteria bacterium]